MFISSLSWSPSNEHHLLSCAFDGEVKLWDTRGNVPVHSVKAHEDKCFAVDFFGPDTFCTGGNDGKLKFYTLPKYNMDEEEE